MSKWNAAAWTILALGVLRAVWIVLRHWSLMAGDRRRWKQYFNERDSSSDE